MAEEKQIARRFTLLASAVDERMRRLFAAAESLAIGYGGVSMVSSATGVSRRAIDAGIEELKPARRMGKIGSPAEGRVRKKGGGRKKNVIEDATLEGDLERLIDPANARRPAIAATLVLQECSQTGRGTPAVGPPSESHACGGVAAGERLQPSGQQQDHRGNIAPRPEGSV